MANYHPCQMEEVVKECETAKSAYRLQVSETKRLQDLNTKLSAIIKKQNQEIKALKIKVKQFSGVRTDTKLDPLPPKTDSNGRWLRSNIPTGVSPTGVSKERKINYAHKCNEISYFHTNFDRSSDETTKMKDVQVQFGPHFQTKECACQTDDIDLEIRETQNAELFTMCQSPEHINKGYKLENETLKYLISQTTSQTDAYKHTEKKDAQVQLNWSFSIEDQANNSVSSVREQYDRQISKLRQKCQNLEQRMEKYKDESFRHRCQGEEKEKKLTEMENKYHTLKEEHLQDIERIRQQALSRNDVALQALKRSCQDLKQENDKYKDDICQLRNQNKESEKKLQEECSREIEKYKADLLQLSKKYQCLEQEKEKYQAELMNKNEYISNLQVIESQFSKLKKENEKYAKALETIKDQSKKHSCEEEHLRRQYQDLEKERERYKQEVLKSLTQRENSSNKMFKTTSVQVGRESEKSLAVQKQQSRPDNIALSNYRKQIQAIEEQCSEYKRERDECINEIANLRGQNMLEKNHQGNTKLQTKPGEHANDRRAQEDKKEIHRLQHELEDTRVRLSKMMGQKITDNNPNITDLGDRNRPTKLAERYTELYDNQWTDAFDIIDTGNESQTIQTLRRILEDTYNYSKEKAKEQMQTIHTALFMDGPAVPRIVDFVQKQLKECRKTTADISAIKMFKSYMSDKPNLYDIDKNISKFVEECCKLCWLMCIQDPPVVLGPGTSRGEVFNSSLYKSYTVSGPRVDYEVWPPLFLCQGGALLCKGVAQGCQ